MKIGDVMFCSHCGRENNQGNSFCVGCGASLSVNNQAIVNSVEYNNARISKNTDTNDIFSNIVKWFFRMGAIILIICLVIVIGSLFFVYNTEHEVDGQEDSYIYLGNKQVPTLYIIMGEYNLCSKDTYNDDTVYIYRYCDIELDKEDIGYYFNELVRNYDFEVDEDNDDYVSVKYTNVNDGYEVFVKAYKPIGEIEYSIVYIEEENSI